MQKNMSIMVQVINGVLSSRKEKLGHLQGKDDTGNRHVKEISQTQRYQHPIFSHMRTSMQMCVVYIHVCVCRSRSWEKVVDMREEPLKGVGNGRVVEYM